MVQPGFSAALDTPRTNLGDATFLKGGPNFADISQEASFQSPSKHDDLLRQLKNGRSNHVNISTPRRKGPLRDRHNLPRNVGDAEFTPMLKSATKNSAHRRGKENADNFLRTPACERIDEEEKDVTPVPPIDTSVYTESRAQSFLARSLPRVDSSSIASTPLAMRRGRDGDLGPLQDGNQLTLREQEDCISRVEKENFGLKLKIHFLEDALRKAGPGFGEDALKENTELRVDKVTIQRELHRYRKHLTSAERDLESYRQKMLDLQEKAKQKLADSSQEVEMELLRHKLAGRELKIDRLQQRLEENQQQNEQHDELSDKVDYLEAELREKENQITNHEDEIEDLKAKLHDRTQLTSDCERLEQRGQQLETALNTIKDLEQDVRILEEQIEKMEDELEATEANKKQCEQELLRLQDDLADKSVMTVDSSREKEDRITLLQSELERSGEEYAILEKKLSRTLEDNAQIRAMLQEVEEEQERYIRDQKAASARIQDLEDELRHEAAKKDVLQSRHQSLTEESSSLQQQVRALKLRSTDLEQQLLDGQRSSVDAEKHLRSQYQKEIDRLNDEVTSLQAEVREKDNLYDNDSEKWQNEKLTLESERDRAEEKVVGLEKTVKRLQEAASNSADKKSRLDEVVRDETERHENEEAVMRRRINELEKALDTRQALLTSLRNNLSVVSDELRQAQINYQTQMNKAVALEDEIEILRAISPGKSQASITQQCQSQKLQDQVAKLQEDVITTNKVKNEMELEAQRATRDVAKLEGEVMQLKSRLSEATTSKQLLQDQLATLLKKTSRAGSEQEQKVAETGDLSPVTQATRLQFNMDKQRLEEENDALSKQRDALEKTLEDELEKAAAEEERLGRLVTELQEKLRSASVSGSQELIAARRNIRELEFRIKEQEAQHQEVQAENGDIRAEEIQKLQEELKMLRRKEEEAALRDLAFNRATKDRKELERQLSDLEDQNVVLEEMLDDARAQAEEVALEHEQTVRHLRQQLEIVEHQRDAADGRRSQQESQEQSLQKKQVEMDNLEYDVRQQQELIESLATTDKVLHRKLDRARSERAAFRVSLEELLRDNNRLKEEVSLLSAAAGSPSTWRNKDASHPRAEMAEDRHRKEVRGMVLQMGWMQARWEREASLRSDAAFAKKFVQLQLEIANACNKAQLRELEHIRSDLLQSREPLALPGGRTAPSAAKGQGLTLRPLLAAVRFIARLRIAARTWAQQEAVRRRLTVATQATRREKRLRQLKVVKVDA